MSIVFKNECASCIDTPLCNKTTMYVDNCDCAVKVMDNSWCVKTLWYSEEIPTNNAALTNWCWYIKWFGSFQDKSQNFCSDTWWLVVLNTNIVCCVNQWLQSYTIRLCDLTDCVYLSKSMYDVYATWFWTNSVYMPAIKWHCYCFGISLDTSRWCASWTKFWIYPFVC